MPERGRAVEAFVADVYIWRDEAVRLRGTSCIDCSRPVLPVLAMLGCSEFDKQLLALVVDFPLMDIAQLYEFNQL
eukprot:XP_001704029.1 Hypothetical protein GL50803_88178 [Giardia lamblia ATCC 50803]